ITRMFLHALKKNFHLGDYSFNEGNLLGDEEGYEVTDSCNYVLPLHHDIGEIQKNFTENCRRNINRTKKSRLNFVDDISVDEIVSLKRLSENVDRNSEHYDYVRKLFSTLLEAGKVKIYGAREGEHLVAAVVFAFSKKRAIYLLSASSEIGKEQRAMFLVLDEFIKMHATQDIKLDFEGSNIASIARFFRGFGAKPEIYQRIRFENPASKIMKIIKSV
nr:GNAT family N-acetyltransferase [Bacteroidales bacterium]